MDNTIIKATRNDEDGSYDVLMDDGTNERFLCFRGSIVWPHETKPGIIILAGEKRIRLIPKIDKIIICEAREFNTLNEAAVIFNELWDRYMPLGYFYNYIENNGFTNNLLKIEGIYKKVSLLYLLDPEKPENVDFGISLIKDYLQGDDKLAFQKKGAEDLSTQLKNMSWDDDSQQYKVTALRYLLTGIHDNPWVPIYIDDFEESQNDYGRNSVTGY